MLDPTTLLIQACQTGKLDDVKLSIADGANKTYRTEAGWTPLMYAACAGYIEVGATFSGIYRL